MPIDRVLKGIVAGILLGAPVALAASPAKAVPETDFVQMTCQAGQHQQQAERMALSLLDTVEVRQAREEAARKWRASAGAISPEMDRLFSSALDELVFSALLRAVGITSDPPVLVSTFTMAHPLDGRMLPGSRYGWDNPDVIYGTIAVDPGASYVITGWLPRRDMQVHFSIVDAQAAILRNVSMSDLRPDPDGRFRITVSSAPGNLSDNHIQVEPDAVAITLRETLADWANDRPVYMRVEKTGGGPSPMAQRPLPQVAAGIIVAMVENMARWRPSLYTRFPVNTIQTPGYPTDKQGLPNQAMALGTFKLADDEAMIIRVTLGGARYFTIPVYNAWGVTGDYRRHTSTFSDRQTVADPDGAFTYVLSPRDPGIHNWLSTNGWHEGDLALRWQELDGQPGEGAGPSVTAKVVKFDDLPGLLPAYVKRVTPAERAAQIEGRQRYPIGLWGQGCANGKTKKGESRP